MDGWRARLLRQLVTRWGWSESTLAELDERQRWRAEDVTTLRRTIVNELTHGYRLLSKMAREHGQRAAISANDINLLGRKLYAAFQRKAGKIEQINPGLAPSLAEENLAFHHQSEQGAGADGWLLYRDLEDPADAFWKPVIRRSGNLAELSSRLRQVLLKEFRLDEANLFLFKSSAESGPFSVTSQSDVQAAVGGLMRGDRIICTTLRQREMTFLFPGFEHSDGSAALIPLHFNGELGLLALGSHDPNHFNSNMDTTFARYVGDILSRRLYHFLK